MTDPITAFLNHIRLGCFIHDAGGGEYIIDGVINVGKALEAVKAIRPELPETDIEAVWQELCDMDDRTSPPDYPDHCLITKAELESFMRGARIDFAP